MICLNCDSEDCEVVMSESFPCSHCDGYIFLEYCICKDCNSMWRAIDGEVDVKNVVSSEELTDLLNPMGNIVTLNSEDGPEIDAAFVKRVEEELIKHNKKDNASTMSDLVHKCMRCQAVAYEVKPGCYECSECDFSWEVIDVDED